jgi:hypothetical protein
VINNNKKTKSIEYILNWVISLLIARIINNMWDIFVVFPMNGYLLTAFSQQPACFMRVRWTGISVHRPVAELRTGYSRQCGSGPAWRAVDRYAKRGMFRAGNPSSVPVQCLCNFHDGRQHTEWRVSCDDTSDTGVVWYVSMTRSIMTWCLL